MSEPADKRQKIEDSQSSSSSSKSDLSLPFSDISGPTTSSGSLPAIVVSLPSSDDNAGESPPAAAWVGRRWSSPDLQRLFLDCSEVIRRARSLTERLDKYGKVKYLVKNLPHDMVCQIYEKIYTSWATLYSSERSSSGTSEGVPSISPDDPQEVFPCDLPYRQTTTSVAPTFTILSMVCNELEKLRNKDSDKSESADVAVLLPLSREKSAQFDTVSSMKESPMPPSAQDTSPAEDMSDPLELLLRLISFNEQELEQNKGKIEKARHFLKEKSKNPTITLTCPSPQKEVQVITEPGPPHVDLLQKFRDCLVQEAQKVAKRLESQISDLKGEASGIDKPVQKHSKVVAEADTTETSSTSVSMKQRPNVLGLGSSGTLTERHATPETTPDDESNLRSTGPCITEETAISTTDDETGRSLPSLPWDDKTPSVDLPSPWEPPQGDKDDDDRNMETAL